MCLPHPAADPLRSIRPTRRMLLLATVMAVEKNVPWGRRLSRPLGLAEHATYCAFS